MTIWLVFELFNLSLNNWHYINLIDNIVIRWICYAIAFGTVLLGLFETFLLVKSFNLFNNVKSGLFTVDNRLKFILITTGIIFLIVSAIFPKYCFPLVWGGFYLIIDPLKIIPQKNSLIYELSEGKPGQILQLLFAGAICGFLWEFWNFWATAKWIYTVPFVGEIKLFEMPVLGFLGFPPFTLECFVMYNFLCAVGLAIPWDIEQNADSYRKINKNDFIIFLLQIPFWLVSFYFIDKYSVVNFR